MEINKGFFQRPVEWIQEKRYGQTIGSFKHDNKPVTIRRRQRDGYFPKYMVLNLCGLKREPIRVYGLEQIIPIVHLPCPNVRIFSEKLIFEPESDHFENNVPVIARSFLALLHQNVYDALIFSFGTEEKNIARAIMEYDDSLKHEHIPQTLNIVGIYQARVPVELDCFTRIKDKLSLAK